MICFNNDYSEGAHPAILRALEEENLRQNPGYGADVQARTPAGETCLHVLVRSQAEPRDGSLRGNLLGLLLMAGCDPAVLDGEGVSPLFAAVECVFWRECEVGATTCIA